jgi:hypothetical protein
MPLDLARTRQGRRAWVVTMQLLMGLTLLPLALLDWQSGRFDYPAAFLVIALLSLLALPLLSRLRRSGVP